MAARHRIGPSLCPGRRLSQRDAYSRLHKRVEQIRRRIPSKSARGAARLALALDDRYPHAHFALGSFNLMSRQHDAAIREIEMAISLNPNYAEAHNELRLDFCTMRAGPKRRSRISTGRWR